MENIKILSILKSSTINKKATIHRDANVFLIRLSGCVRYEFKDEVFDVTPGNVIFIPKDSDYIFTKLSDFSCEYISIRFESTIRLTTPSVYSIQEFEQIDEMINKLEYWWKFGNKSEHYKCYSVFYNFLSYIETRKNLTEFDKKKFNIISPAISYLKNHIYDCELKVGNLNQICGISNVYFNKIFHDNYGTNPQSFVLSKRLAHAKAIIDSGDYNSISELSESVGYNDPLYFSRAFKKKFGISPAKYASSQFDT